MSTNPYPNLLHPTQLVIEPHVPSTTLQDSSATEPIQTRAPQQPITIEALVEQRWYGLGEHLWSSKSGAKENEFGYVMVRRRDCQALNYTPRLGDKLISHSGKIVDPNDPDGRPIHAYVHRFVRCGHYPKHGWTLLKLYYGSRKPARTTSDAND